MKKIFFILGLLLVVRSDAQILKKITDKAKEKVDSKVDKKIDDAAKRSAEKSAKVDEIFQRGVGGGEAAEKIKKIEEGIKLWGDAAVSSQERSMALFGSIGIGLRMVGPAMAQYVSAVREASIAVATQNDQSVQLRGSYELLRTAAGGAISSEQALGVQRQINTTSLHLSNEQMQIAVRAAADLAATEGGTLESNLSTVTSAFIT